MSSVREHTNTGSGNSADADSDEREWLIRCALLLRFAM